MLITTLQGDCRQVLKSLPDNSVNCVVTSPPYWGLRDYQSGLGEIGQEKSPQEYIETMVEVFSEVHRVLKPDGTLWLNLGDSYSTGGTTKQTGRNDNGRPDKTKGWAEYDIKNTKIFSVTGLGAKQLLLIPHRVALALQEWGWILRSTIIWHKTNPMPESVTDRPTNCHEYIFLFSKQERYYYDNDVIKEPVSKSTIKRWGTNKPDRINPTSQGLKVASVLGESTFGTSNGERNKRSVWIEPTSHYSGSHYAVFPEKLIEPCVLAGCPAGGTVLDPFGGSGTVGKVAIKHSRNALLIELNPAYIELINERTDKVQVKMAI